MKKFLASSVPILLILLLSLFLRWWHYGDFPVMGETKDEYAYTWLGNSLLTGQPPTSWSWYEHYPNKKIVILLGEQFPIASPWFDSPPLFSLIPGFMTVLKGSNGIVIPPITLIRFPMLLLGTLNVLLLYLVACVWFDKKTALYSSLLYATIPLFVISSRMVLTENLIITWLLLGLFLVKRFLAKQSNTLACILGAVAGLAILTKISGLIVFGSISMVLVVNKRYKHLIPFTLAFLVVASLWLVHGYIYGWDFFWQTLTRQGSLEIGFASLLQFFIHPTLVERVWLDGWFYVGLLAIMVYVFLDAKSRSKNIAKPLFIVPLMWLALYLISTREQTWHGWYRYPLFPFMALAIGRWFAKGMTTTMRLFPIVLFGLLPSLNMLLFVNSISMGLTMIKLVIVVLMLLCSLDLIINLSTQWRKRLILSVFVFMLVVNALVIISITNPKIYEYQQYLLNPI